jgi:hypothetical protein
MVLAKWKAWSCLATLGVGVLVLAPACGEDDAAPIGPGVTDAGAVDANVSVDSNVGPGQGECSIDAECTAKLPATTPADCAVAKCDPVAKKCHFVAKDADGDGHKTKKCTAGAAVIELGDDCDDGDVNSYPGAWDGPATDFDSGPGVKQDRCDQKDNDCNGSPDDGRFPVEGGDKTCVCDPNHPLPCYDYPNGVPISATTLDGNNKPKGTCKKGVRNCVNGIPGACDGAVGPDLEICDDSDHDCDGLSGNAGDTAQGMTSFCPDEDNDKYCTFGACVTKCAAPAKHIAQSSCLGTDCNDGNPTVFPNNPTDYCGDGIDSNCTGGDNDKYPNYGTPCTSGTFGVCRRTGSWQCTAAKTSTECSAAAGSASGAHDTMSADSAIDTSQNRAGYDARWDWDCDNNWTVSTQYITGGSFRSYACNSDWANACKQFGTMSECNAGNSWVFGTAKYFNCETYYTPGIGFRYYDATNPAQICGRQLGYVACAWQWFSGSTGCDALGGGAPSSSSTVSCK